MSQVTATVPFGARAEQRPHTITLEAGSLSYDPDRQLNVMIDGSLRCQCTIPSTCTNTTTTKNDDTPDPYLFV
ncbi:MAG: putative ATP-grasp-modified RiPP [Propionibacteriales bacterium]|nr:putative ATP-grasp-modified RiPP [Propionibacteriales bacterium]